MADAKSSINDKSGRQRILEGLWLIGIEPSQLNVSADLDGNAFLAALHKNGVDDTFVGRAMAGVDWRAPEDNQPLTQKVAELLRVAGYRPDEVELFASQARLYGGQTGGDAKAIMGLLTQQFNERTAGAIIFKATGGQAPSGAVWNPFRTDTPPTGVDLKYGGGGVLATNLPPGMTSAEPTNKFAQPGSPNPAVPTSATSGVPTPPASVRATPAKAPGPPTISGQTPGAATVPGAGPGAGGTPAPIKLTPEQIRADIETRYGWAAAMMDIPEVAKILSDAGAGLISAEEANRRWLNTDYYKTTSVNQRSWRILEKTGGGEAAVQLQAQVDSITAKARTLGITVDPARIAQIAKLSKEFGWSDQMVNGALASEVKWDPQGAKTGVLAQIKASQQSQLVPMSDGAMTQWAQAIVGGSKSQADFDAYLKDQAKSLFPGMANYLDTTPGGTVQHYLDPYAQTIEKTLGMPAGNIDWMDPKWFRFVNSTDQKTGQRGMVDIADVQRTLIADPTYGYDQTNNGKQAKAGLARTILSDWGFIAPGGSSSGGFG